MPDLLERARAAGNPVIEGRTANRRMRDLLQQRGYTFAYREYNAGHNYPAWRDDIWRGLEWSFGPATPGPLPETSPL